MAAAVMANEPYYWMLRHPGKQSHGQPHSADDATSLLTTPITDTPEKQLFSWAHPPVFKIHTSSLKKYVVINIFQIEKLSK